MSFLDPNPLDPNGLARDLLAPYKALWYRALNDEIIGIAVKTSDPARFRQFMYRARKETYDPLLNSVSLQSSRDDPKGEVWIMRTNAREAVQAYYNKFPPTLPQDLE